MNKDVAKLSLGWHSCIVKDESSRKYTSGYTGCLQPYVSSLKYINYLDVYESMLEFHDDFRDEGKIDKEITGYIFNIVNITWRFALRKGSPVRRSGRMSDIEFDKLECWTNSISELYTSMLLGSSYELNELKCQIIPDSNDGT